MHKQPKVVDFLKQLDHPRVLSTDMIQFYESKDNCDLLFFVHTNDTEKSYSVHRAIIEARFTTTST